MSGTRVLTVSDVTALAEIASAAWQNARVRYVNTDGRVVEGTARCFTTPSGLALSSSDVDVRDAHLLVTTDVGVEVHPEVSYLMALVHEGGFARL